MSASDDSERARLDAVAGVSRARPEMTYTVEGLSFGAATLTREADGRWSTLTLSLTEEAAATTAAPTEKEVSVEVRYWLTSSGSTQREDAERFEGVRSLLVEHHVLSRPKLLLRADGGAPIEGAAAKALDAVRVSVARVRSRAVACPVCDDPVAARRFRDMERERQLRGYTTSMGHGWRRGAVDCAHAAMRDEAFEALFAAHPELAFEAAQVLSPAVRLDPPRFVLHSELLAPLLGHWLMRRARDRYGYLDYGYAYRRGTERRKMTRVPQSAALSPALRGALHYAAQSWEASGPLEGFAPPATDAAEGMPTMTSSSEPIDVAVMWPEGVTRPAPKPERAAKEPAERAAPQAPAKKTSEKKAGPAVKRTPKPATEEAAVKAPSPGQMLMTAELRALGYSDAKVKSLLAAGTIERAGFGWFRWKG